MLPSVQYSPLSDQQFELLNKNFETGILNVHEIDQIIQTPKKRFYQKQESRWLFLLKKMNQTFIHLEQEGVIIFPDQKEEWKKYQTLHAQYLHVAKKVLEFSQKEAFSNELKNVQFETRCRLAGYRYQLGAENGGLSSLQEPDLTVLEKLKQEAKKWKNGQELAVNKELNHIDLSQLKELAQYPEWITVVLENPTYLKEVFSWCLKEDCSVEVLVKCYETRKRIKASLLSGYLGYGRNQDVIAREDEVLAFRDIFMSNGQSKRVLTMAIYHGDFLKFDPTQQERVNILNPNEKILFKRGNRKLTVQQLFKECARKNETEVDFTPTVWGIINRHPVYGVWQAETKTYECSHLKEKNWIDFIPPVALASDEELKKRYKGFNRREMFFKVMSSRQYLGGLNASKAHSYLLIYVPMEDGNWKVVSIGFFAYRFQGGLLDQFMLIGNTSPRILCENDQNHCYTMRQRAEAEPIFPPSEQMKEFLNLLAKKRTGGVFQFSARNCAHPIQTYAEKCFRDLPNFFKMRLTQGTLGIGFFDRLLYLGNQLVKKNRLLFVGGLHRVLGSRRILPVYKEDPTQPGYSVYSYVKQYTDPWGKYWLYYLIKSCLQWILSFPASLWATQGKKRREYSVYEYFQKPKYQGEEIYNPAYLPYQIQNNLLRGTLYWSLSDEKIFQKERASV